MLCTVVFSLRNCQNLVAESSRRGLELNSQLVAVRQEEVAARLQAEEAARQMESKAGQLQRVTEDRDTILAEV